MRTASLDRLDQPQLSLPAWRVRSVGFQVALITAAVVLPHVAHVTGAPVLWFLPMHWPVILAGLVYGPAAGLAVGLLSPTISFSLSGMPPMPFLATMTVELGLYGLLIGMLRSHFRWQCWLAVGAALVAGRVVAMSMGLAMGLPFSMLLGVCAQGLLAGLAQVVTLPLIARWWVQREGPGTAADQDAR
jgi:uncharacterized membrane protein